VDVNEPAGGTREKNPEDFTTHFSIDCLLMLLFCVAFLPKSASSFVFNQKLIQFNKSQNTE